jgi:hypothetical protein
LSIISQLQIKFWFSASWNSLCSGVPCGFLGEVSLGELQQLRILHVSFPWSVFPLSQGMGERTSITPGHCFSFRSSLSPQLAISAVFRSTSSWKLSHLLQYYNTTAGVQCTSVSQSQCLYPRACSFRNIPQLDSRSLVSTSHKCVKMHTYLSIKNDT